ncbi:uncharacterized protein RHIMIDRAFT_279833, partial [Rhizopus microsporus ATCC 52813]
MAFSFVLNKCCHCRNVNTADGYAVSFMFKKLSLSKLNLEENQRHPRILLIYI